MAVPFTETNPDPNAIVGPLPLGDPFSDSGSAPIDTSMPQPVVQVAGFTDYLLADTVGVAWRAVSGTVDPFTKKILVQQQIDGQGSAGQDPAMLQKIATDAQAVGTKVLMMNGADPSQFWQGLQNSLSKFGTLSATTVLIIGGVALVLIVVTRPR